MLGGVHKIHRIEPEALSEFGAPRVRHGRDLDHRGPDSQSRPCAAGSRRSNPGRYTTDHPPDSSGSSSCYTSAATRVFITVSCSRHWELNWKQQAHIHVLLQLTVMNTRVAALVSQDKSRWNLAGDQLYIDLDLSDDDLPRDATGDRVRADRGLVRSAQGCAKFVERFGLEAMNL